MGKTLVLYVFHIYNKWVERFINKCIFYDESVDFIVICNDIHIEFNVPSYVKKINRPNAGFDFGGWSYALLKDNLYINYDTFIFVNSSVIGPFICPYYNGKWTDIYLNGLKNNVKLFGSTINTWPLELSHVQSYIFSMDKITLEYLISCGIFSLTNNYESLIETVNNKEIAMSRKVIERGWNIGCLLDCYKNVDFTISNKKPEEYNIQFYDDLMYEHNRGSLWNEYALVFIKINRIYDEKNIADLERELDFRER